MKKRLAVQYTILLHHFSCTCKSVSVCMMNKWKNEDESSAMLYPLSSHLYQMLQKSINIWPYFHTTSFFPNFRPLLCMDQNVLPYNKFGLFFSIMISCFQEFITIKFWNQWNLDEHFFLSYIMIFWPVEIKWTDFCHITENIYISPKERLHKPHSHSAPFLSAPLHHCFSLASSPTLHDASHWAKSCVPSSGF